MIPARDPGTQPDMPPEEESVVDEPLVHADGPDAD
jgi:hypothetical protein